MKQHLLALFAALLPAFSLGHRQLLQGGSLNKDCDSYKWTTPTIAKAVSFCGAGKGRWERDGVVRHMLSPHVFAGASLHLHPAPPAQAVTQKPVQDLQWTDKDGNVSPGGVEAE
jgi:hypothetical protein